VEIYRLQVFGLDLEGSELCLAIELREFVHPYFNLFRLTQGNFKQDFVSFLALELNLRNDFERNGYVSASSFSCNYNHASVAEFREGSLDPLAVNNYNGKILFRLRDLIDRSITAQSPHAHKEQKRNYNEYSSEIFFH